MSIYLAPAPSDLPRSEVGKVLKRELKDSPLTAAVLERDIR